MLKGSHHTDMHAKCIIVAFTLITLSVISSIPVKRSGVVHPYSNRPPSYSSEDAKGSREEGHLLDGVVLRTMIEDAGAGILDIEEDEKSLKRLEKECRQLFALNKPRWGRKLDYANIKSYCKKMVRDDFILTGQLSPQPVCTEPWHDNTEELENSKPDQTTTMSPSDLCDQQLKDLCSPSQLQDSLRDEWLITRLCNKCNGKCGVDCVNSSDHTYPSHFPEQFTHAKHKYDVYFDVNVFDDSSNYVVYIPQCLVMVADERESLIHNATSGHFSILHHERVSEVQTQEFRVMWMGVNNDSSSAPGSEHVKPFGMESIGNVTCQKYNVTGLINENILNSEPEAEIHGLKFKLEAVCTTPSGKEAPCGDRACVPSTELFLGTEPKIKSAPATV